MAQLDFSMLKSFSMATPTRALSDPPRTVTASMAERRERILKSARAIIATAGIEGLTMRQLATRSRVTVPTLYNLVGGRDRLIQEAVRDQNRQFLEGLVIGEDTDPAARVMAVADACTGEFLGSADYYRSLLSWMFTSPGAAEVRQDVGSAFTQELRAGLMSLSEAGRLAKWVDEGHLADRMAAHLANASLEWASGSLSSASFRALAKFETAVSLRAVVTDAATQAELDAIAEAAQSQLQRGRRRSPRRQSKSTGEGS